MLNVLAVVRPLLPYVKVMVMESVDVAPNSAYTESKIHGNTLLLILLQLTVIAGVGPADPRRVHPRLSRDGQGVETISDSGGGGSKARKGLEIQSQLTDVTGHLVDSVGAGGGTGGCVAAGVSWVPDVGGVGGDGSATGGGGYYTANSEPSSAVSVSTSTFSGTFRAGVAGSEG